MAFLTRQERRSAAELLTRRGRRRSRLDPDLVRQHIDAEWEFQKLEALEHALARGTEYVVVISNDSGDTEQVEVPLGRDGIARIKAVIDSVKFKLNKVVPDLKAVEMSGSVSTGTGKVYTDTELAMRLRYYRDRFKGKDVVQEGSSEATIPPVIEDQFG